MAVALRRLAMGEEALRHDEVQIILRPRHGDVKQAPLLLDFGRRPGGEIGGDAAVDGVEQKHRLPFLALGGMDGREDQIILVEQRRAGLIAGGVGRIERQFGQEALARGIAGRDLFELQQVGLAHRRRPRACVPDAARTSAARSAISAGQPAFAERKLLQGRRRKPASRRPRAAAPECWQARKSDRVDWPSGRARAAPTTARRPGSSCITRKPATRSRGFCAKRSTASTSLTWALSRNFRPPNLTKGMLRRVSSTSSGPL